MHGKQEHKIDQSNMATIQTFNQQQKDRDDDNKIWGDDDGSDRDNNSVDKMETMMVVARWRWQWHCHPQQNGNSILGGNGGSAW